MRRRAFFLFATALLAACSGPLVRPTPTAPPDVAAEEVAVYATAIEAYLSGAPDPLVLASQTSMGRGSDITATLDYLTEQLPDLAPDALASFSVRNSRAEPLATDMGLPYRYLLISAEEQQAIFQGSGGGWDEFYRRYPNAQGIMELSRVGFSADMTQALVYVGNQSYYLAGAGYYYLLVKENDTWRVAERALAWIS